MKILEVVDSFFPIVDGVANVVKNYAKILNKTEQCALAVPTVAKKLKYKDEESFEIIRCSSMWAPEGYRNAFPDFDIKNRKKIMEENYDIFHAHSPFAMGKFAVKLAKKKKIPVVMTLHTKYKEDFKRLLKSRFLTWFMVKYIIATYKKADVVWTVSEASKEVLRSYGYKGKVDVVRNGTDFSYPENSAELIDLVNKEHSLENKKNVFLFVGRMSFYKNIKLIADALKILKDKGIDFTMLFVGEGFDYEEFKKYVENIGIGENVIFVGGVYDRSILQAYYLRSDLFIFPSTFDTSGIVTVEAATHKTPAVLIKGSCAAEGVTDGENGFLCDNSVESLAEKLEYLALNPSVMKDAGENAYNTLYRSWEMVVDEVKEKYAEVIKNYNERERIKKLLRKPNIFKRIGLWFKNIWKKIFRKKIKE